MKPKETHSHVVLSSSPHVHADISVSGMMADVLIALLPSACCAVYFFGLRAVWLMATCIAAAVTTEAACRWAMRRETSLGDFSAVLTGLLLAFNLPPDLPLWMAAVGSAFAIGIAKQAFGGIGYNPFNPALAGRAFMLISFTGPMTTWTASRWTGYFDPAGIEAMTHATPLAAIKAGTMSDVLSGGFLLDLFIGNVNGCLGEVSALALLTGAVYLLARRVITWHIPVAFIGTVFLFALCAGGVPPLVHVLSGGVILGACFMATDWVTSPVQPLGKILFGCGCGLLTMLIRLAPNGAYPEGVSFSILIMNAFSPLIDRWTRPKPFGAGK